ncbi:MAG TPA: geranylgeranylglycerol-phosphate geranylgeranyltransferase [Sediminibacterium sp.]|nr:geranylgeranylglycerol-phosphate geranylgeranyltransferase [Sediminibacterium sp.]
MKLVAAFFKLIRWPNLLFIVLTQILFEVCIYERIYPDARISDPSEGLRFAALVLASVFIAAAGYIINDYFDQNIDQVNKPDKVVVNRIIGRRWVIFWHMFFSLTGIFFTAFALPVNQYWHLVLANMLSIVALWFYSTTLKKKLLVGNVMISLLTAWVIGVLFFSKYPLNIHNLLSVQQQEARFFRLMIVYAAFAFVISLIREVIKDMEDIEGDRRYGCTTMPIVWGINASKVFVAVWVIVLIAALVILQIYALGLGWWKSVLYALLLIVTPLLMVLRLLFRAAKPEDYHRISSLVKLVMFAGILSMLFFKFYH